MHISYSCSPVLQSMCYLLFEMGTPRRISDGDTLLVLKKRLERCWNLDIEWDLYPSFLKEGFAQLGRSLDVPASAVLSGLLLVESYCLSHCVIRVPNTEWTEPSLLWLTICMPTGSGKTPLCGFLTNLLDQVRSYTETDEDTPWMVDDASMEKMGAMMANNGSKLLGLYDELSTFLTQINVYRGKGISDSHDLSAFLSLYNGKSWNRDTVSGDANFHMKKTALTVGGFTQPNVAKSLIESPQAIEKGLVQRFLWLFPKPSYSDFASLQKANQNFVEYLVSKLTAINALENTVLTLPGQSESTVFKSKFDELQESIAAISVCDELLAGMLGKAKGQILRIAACLQMFFSDTCTSDDEERIIPATTLPTTLTEDALKAAINFVEVCCQHTAYITGRQTIENEVKKYKQTDSEVVYVNPSDEGSISTAAYCLLLTGVTLDLSSLLSSKKFRTKGGKEGALAAMRLLQSDGLGTLTGQKAHRGVSMVYTFEKTPVPGDNIKEFAEKLSKYGVSLCDYEESFKDTRNDSSPKRPRIEAPKN